MGYERANYSVKDIVAWFLLRNKKEEEENGSERMTLLKLLKLLYYAEGCSLAANNRSLFNEDIIAWEHGPVVRDVYYDYCSDPYNLPISKEDKQRIENISSADQSLLEEVFTVFGQYNAWALRNKTHSETPWLEATDNGTHLNGNISRDTMRSYFAENYID